MKIREYELVLLLWFGIVGSIWAGVALLGVLLGNLPVLTTEPSSLLLGILFWPAYVATLGARLLQNFGLTASMPILTGASGTGAGMLAGLALLMLNRAS